MVPKVKIDAAIPKIDLMFCMDCCCSMCRDPCYETVDGSDHLVYLVLVGALNWHNYYTECYAGRIVLQTSAVLPTQPLELWHCAGLVF